MGRAEDFVHKSMYLSFFTMFEYFSYVVKLKVFVQGCTSGYLCSMDIFGFFNI